MAWWQITLIAIYFMIAGAFFILGSMYKKDGAPEEDVKYIIIQVIQCIFWPLVVLYLWIKGE